VFDWLANMELPGGQQAFEGVEIRFKNSRKEFFRNVTGHSLAVGDVVAVEASPGHDIGTVSLTGELVRTQMARRGVKADVTELKKIYRKAKPADIEKWLEAQALEKPTMVRSRVMATQLGLEMKIGDVEYQGDKSKAIFYYTAEDRVDFRELIRVMADEFRIRIEMKQIGARQEAARLGGIGTCGRELCCSTWLTDFRSVTTSAARYQQLSLNPLKLAGQCGKLKCCLNYELDTYMDALKHFPETVDIEIAKGRARHQKTDIFKGLLWYTFADEPDKFIPVPVSRVKEIIALNKNGEKPEILVETAASEPRRKEPDFENVVGQDSLTRFDRSKGNNKKKKKKGSDDRLPQQKQQQPQAKQAGPQPQTPPPQGQQQRKPQQNQQRGPQQPRKPQEQRGPKPPQQNQPPQNPPQGQQQRGNQPKPPQQNQPPQQNKPGGQQNNNRRNDNRNNRGNNNRNNRGNNLQGPPPPPPPPSAPPPFI
jgi:cell fate regulator YaaT (PSP1 superfamily)